MSEVILTRRAKLEALDAVLKEEFGDRIGDRLSEAEGLLSAYEDPQPAFHSGKKVDGKQLQGIIDATADIAQALEELSEGARVALDAQLHRRFFAAPWMHANRPPITDEELRGFLAYLRDSAMDVVDRMEDDFLPAGQRKPNVLSLIDEARRAWERLTGEVLPPKSLVEGHAFQDFLDRILEAIEGEKGTSARNQYEQWAKILG